MFLVMGDPGSGSVDGKAASVARAFRRDLDTLLAETAQQHRRRSMREAHACLVPDAAPPIETRAPLQDEHRRLRRADDCARLRDDAAPPATLADARRHHRPGRRWDCNPVLHGPPQITRITLPACRPTTPANRGGCSCRLLPRSRAAFPESQAGRHPRLHFRGLLRLHSRYGPPDRSTAPGGL